MPGVYISWPFCAQKCTYCNFASGVFPKELEAKYAETLETEIQSHVWTWIPETVYLGGGTPSNATPEVLAKILAAVPGAPWREATIEAAPGSLTQDVISGWRNALINRVSFGSQSFVSKELKSTGRKHDAATVQREIALLREQGIDSINLDLIAGLPGQTRESWGESLDWIERLNVPHVSVYMLEVDDDSRLGREIRAGGTRYGAAEIPEDDSIAEFYEIAVERLEGMGIRRYEISNFARPGYESVHNLKYWKREPYLGFGADAHSFDGEMRWSNPETITDYVQKFAAESKAFVLTDAETPANSKTTADPIGEKFFLGLRLAEGIQGRMAPFEEVVERFIRQGLLERADDRVRLSSRGVLLSNEVFREFVG